LTRYACPSSLIKALVSEPVLTAIRRELNRVCEFRLDIEDVFSSIKNGTFKDMAQCKDEMKKILLDKEKIALEKEIEMGEWVPVRNMAEEIKKYQSHAQHALNKNSS